MKLVFSDNRFEARNYNKDKLPGFSKDDETGVLYTVDAQIAKAYLHYASDSATEFEVYKQEAELKSAILQSRKLTSNIVVPAPKGCYYDPYQLAAIEYGVSRKRVIFADEQRLGKTIEALGLVNFLISRRLKRAPRGLAICKGNLKDNWEREMYKWLLEEHGIEQATPRRWPRYAQWVIVNYDLLERFYDEMRWQPWDFLILDETQKLTNPSAGRTQYVYGAPHLGLEPIPAERVIGLSGTPFNNRPIELFPTLHYFDPDRWPSRIEYGVKYCDGKKNEKTGKWNFNGASSLPQLQAKLRSTILIRRMFDEVYPFMPPKRRQVIEIPPGESDIDWIKEELEAWDSYNSMLETAMKKVETAKDLNDDEAFKEAMRSLAYTKKIRFAKISAFRHRTAVAKIPFVLSYIEDVLDEGGKLVVFAHHQDMIEAIYKKFPDAGINYGGKMQIRTALEEQDRFQGGDPACRLMICAISMSEGQHYASAHHEVFAEFPWHASGVLQCESRCRGRESINPVLIQFMVLAHSLDANQAHKIVNKLSQQEDALDKNEVWEDLPEGVA